MYKCQDCLMALGSTGLLLCDIRELRKLLEQ